MFLALAGSRSLYMYVPLMFVTVCNEEGTISYDWIACEIAKAGLECWIDHISQVFSLPFQASLRYFSSFGLRPVLALKTSEGAFMSPEDRIVDVLSTNEEVVASVESWDLPALSERYQDACVNSSTRKSVHRLFVPFAQVFSWTVGLPVSLHVQNRKRCLPVIITLLILTDAYVSYF